MLSTLHIWTCLIPRKLEHREVKESCLRSCRVNIQPRMPGSRGHTHLPAKWVFLEQGKHWAWGSGWTWQEQGSSTLLWAECQTPLTGMWF